MQITLPPTPAAKLNSLTKGVLRLPPLSQCSQVQQQNPDRKSALLLAQGSGLLPELLSQIS